LPSLFGVGGIYVFGGTFHSPSTEEVHADEADLAAEASAEQSSAPHEA
jgi:hypothetical protein